MMGAEPSTAAEEFDAAQETESPRVLRSDIDELRGRIDRLESLLNLEN